MPVPETIPETVVVLLTDKVVSATKLIGPVRLRLPPPRATACEAGRKLMGLLRVKAAEVLAPCNEPPPRLSGPVPSAPALAVELLAMITLPGVKSMLAA